jgi:hypothetical protein
METAKEETIPVVDLFRGRAAIETGTQNSYTNQASTEKKILSNRHFRALPLCHGRSALEIPDPELSGKVLLSPPFRFSTPPCCW